MLLIHGYTGAPPEVRLVGDYLHQRGYTVSGPLLPGHGTTAQEMNHRQWSDWAGHVEGALADLQARCETLFVGGLSMGALFVCAIYIYSMGATCLGDWGEVPGWVVFMSVDIITGNFWGTVTGEWNAAPRRARKMLNFDLHTWVNT